MDYRNFSPSGPNDSGATDKRWWLSSKEELARNVCAIVKNIQSYDSRRQTQYQISTRLYGNTHLIGLHGLSATKMSAVQSSLKDRISYNVVQSAVDTITSKMSKNKPRPLFLTSGGDWHKQRKAKKLDKFTEGLFYENDAYTLGRLAFRDAAVLGDGLVHVFAHYGRVKFERVMASELYVDPVEAFYGYPRQLHRIKNIDRAVLVDMFPNKKKQIMSANSASSDITGFTQNVADQITVGESWHLPSGPESDDGIHVIWIENEALVIEEWDKDYFPFAKMPWCTRLNGFWSQGGAEQIQNIQLEINKLLWVIQRSMHLAGTFKVWFKTGAKVVKEHLTNDIGAIIQSDEMPQYLTPPIVQPEVYSHLMTLKNQAFEQFGISQLSATSQKPAGLNSGKALREYNDIESDRYHSIGQSYEKFYMDLAKLGIETAKEIYEKDGEYKVKAPSKKLIEEIDWSDVDLEADSYVMHIFPISSLPQDPAGRLQTIQEYAQAGFINPRTAKRLLSFPDLEQVENLQDAEEDYLTMIIEKMADKGEFTPPEPEDDLDLALQIALEYYAQGKLNNLEQDRLEMLRAFMDQVKLLKQKAMPPQPQPQPGAMGVPQASPEPMPQSDLLQNVPGGMPGAIQ